MGMLAIFDNTPREKLEILGEVHDSILMWVKDEYLDEMLPIIKSSMESPPLLSRLVGELPIPIVADLEVGEWGNGKTWKGPN